MAREIIDIHSHCFRGAEHAGLIRADLEAARRLGLQHLVVVGLINTKLDSEEMWSFIPRYVENHGDPLFHEADNLLSLAETLRPTLLPFVDTRHLWGEPERVLTELFPRGFRGVKGIYLGDERNDLGVRSAPEAFGITLEEYHNREWGIFAFAHARDLPLVYHMDARTYGDVMRALLDDFPGLRVDFAHMGISRKAFRKILDRYPNVYTDFASMLPLIQKDPESYRQFILDYPDRVCFGTDAFLYTLENIPKYIRMVEGLRLPEEVEEKVFSKNPRRFLGGAREVRGEPPSAPKVSCRD
ncbi:MAG: amidohydrolase family protein [Deltaproteobacteria bacterium]|nr:amidohydrolase family protein [Deltaproteobacteria bacterium]